MIHFWTIQELKDVAILAPKDFHLKYPNRTLNSIRQKMRHLNSIRQKMRHLNLKKTIEKWSEEEIKDLQILNPQAFIKKYPQRTYASVILKRAYEKGKNLEVQYDFPKLKPISVLSAGQKAAITRRKNKELRESLIEVKKPSLRTPVEERFEELIKYARSL